MFEELNEHRQAVQENIRKAFEVGFTGNDIEKAKQWQVGDEATDKHGVTYYVHALNAAGKPLWRKKKDGGAKATNSSLTEQEKKEKSLLESAVRSGRRLSQRDANRLDVLQRKERQAAASAKAKLDTTKIDQAEYDKAYKTATSATETEEHLKSSLAKIEENIKTIKDALANASDATAGKMQKMLTASVSKKKAIEDALKDKKNGSTKKPVSFVPKHTFKNAYDMANKMNTHLEKNIDIQQFVDILGKTVYDKGVGTKHRNIRAGSGSYGEWDCSTSSYLQKDGSGDYLEFKDKPSQEKLDKCAKLLKDILAKEGYDVNPKFTVLSHNSYYQHNNTFGVGISIKITKKEVQSSSKTK